ncbi:MAG: hypothetical protein ACI9BW_001968 [Gammaproteobacteria bacterium]|jgi:hypothetical protein
MRCSHITHLEFCLGENREPKTLDRTVTALVADACANPWSDKLPTDNWVEEGPLVPLAGAPVDIAAVLHEYHAEGINHLHICLEPTTCASIEAFAKVLEAFDKADSR